MIEGSVRQGLYVVAGFPFARYAISRERRIVKSLGKERGVPLSRRSPIEYSTCDPATLGSVNAEMQTYATSRIDLPQVDSTQSALCLLAYRRCRTIFEQELSSKLLLLAQRLESSDSKLGSNLQGILAIVLIRNR